MFLVHLHIFKFAILPYLFYPFSIVKTSTPTLNETQFIYSQPVADHYMRVDDMIFLMKKTKAGLSGEAYKWPDGIIPYKVQNGFSKEMHKMLKDTMDILEEQTCIEFVRRTDEKDYLYISYTDSGCYAHVGFMNRGGQKLNLGKGCWKFGTVVHELIHSIGFSHEHQRNDRDKFVTIHYENMKPGKEHNFKLDGEMGMKFEYFGLPYNYASVMHYSGKAFSKNGNWTIIPKKAWKVEEDYLFEEIDKNGRPVIGLNDLTWGDVTMINRMYDDYCE